MKRFHHILTSVIIACMAVAFNACSMMEEDRSDCPTGLFVRFVYDYNTQRADMFKDHVGYVTVYVYDESGQKVAEKSVANTTATMPLAQYGYTMHFTEAELPAGHRYRLQAVAMQKDWDAALATPGAKYRRNNPTNATSLTIALDHEPTTVSAAATVPAAISAAATVPGTISTAATVPTTVSAAATVPGAVSAAATVPAATVPDGSPSGLHAVSNAAPMDTLWHTLKVMPYEPTYGYDAPTLQRTTKPYSVYPVEDQMVTLRPGYATYATISLIRDTKHLNITLRQLDNPADINADDYEVTIVDDNAVLGADNSLQPGDSLLYTPYAQWTTRFDEDGLAIEGDIHPATRATVASRAAHYDVMFNRLMFNDDSEKSAKLCIRHKPTGKVVGYFNLPYLLAEGRIAWEMYNYGPQEYLDREYDYRLELFLKGDQWQYVDIVINVLSWSKRKQYVEFN